MILDKITSSEIKNLTIPELYQLAREIRLEIIDTVITNGGHLSGNLGVVELTIALHYVFDFPKDKLIFDVGHQCYTHKLLTGRYERFKTLRKKDGISGFPKKSESKYDVFDSGHSGNSASVGLGLARARDLAGEKFEVISLVGDASLTTGMCLEALNDAGANPTKQIVILNDNNMSIAGNVGAVSASLTKLRTKSTYKRIKRKLVSIVSKHVKGPETISKFKRVKNSFKYMLMRGVFFEEFGLKYLGPIDGHNFKELIEYLTLAKNETESIVLHVITRKGKGCVEAEENPGKYHGISPLINSGIKAKSYSDIFGETLTELAEKDKKIVAVTAAMRDGTGLTRFAKEHRDRFFDVGIAEEHAVTMSAGLALGGYKPYFAVYSSFLQRGYDQLIEDVALQGLPVRICVDRSGIVGSDGETHQGIYDNGYLNTIPDLTILTPCGKDALKEALIWSKDYDKPLIIKYPRGACEPQNKVRFIPYKWCHLIDADSKIVILSVGASMSAEAEKAAFILAEKGIQTDVVCVNCIKPLDKELLLSLKNKTVVTIEDNVEDGGFGSVVNDFFCKNRIKTDLHILALKNTFVTHATVNETLEANGLSAKNIAEYVKNIIN